MGLAALAISATAAPALSSFFAALQAAIGPPRTPPAPARPAAYSLPLRVRVALQAAARARR